MPDLTPLRPLTCSSGKREGRSPGPHQRSATPRTSRIRRRIEVMVEHPPVRRPGDFATFRSEPGSDSLVRNRCRTTVLVSSLVAEPDNNLSNRSSLRGSMRGCPFSGGSTQCPSGEALCFLLLLVYLFHVPSL